MAETELFTGQPGGAEEQPVECLGLTFVNEEARRAYFTDKLRQGLEELQAKLGGVPFTSVEDAVARLRSVERWPVGDEARLWELAQRMRRGDAGKDLLQRWQDEVGFPHGEIEDILRLSDPPYYTACPNPFLDDFIKLYGKHYDPAVPYNKEPFAADVSEGKNDPIYNAHSYHTKVPHKAIMRYILHYTEPGDLVFDGFAGTGMTGVAAQLCGDRQAVESLGYRVQDDGTILKPEEENGRTVWRPFSRLGARRAILNDLSPAATFIAYNYNTPVDVAEFEGEARRILQEVEDECGWMYLTLHNPAGDRVARALDLLSSTPPAGWTKVSGLSWGRINYTVWSDVFVCPECSGEVIFWDAAVDKEAGRVRDAFPCPHCNARLTKRTMERAWVTRYDKAINQTVRQTKQVPVLINYTYGRKRFEKKPDAFDLALIEKIEESDIPYWFPTDRMPEGYNTEQPKVSHGITHVHHFYTKRNLWVLSALRKRVGYNRTMNYWLNSLDHGLSKRVKHGNWSFPMSVLSGTLYIPALSRENNPLHFYPHKLTKHIKAFRYISAIRSLIFLCSTAKLNSRKYTVEYIFVDPPFGGNLMYSELNFPWEAWLRVFTNNKPEAVENKVQSKGLAEYKELMTRCFREYYRVLKPGRWMTVVFHNSKNSVWNAIQEALQDAGFVVADVRILDKKQGTFKQVTSGGAVKQDLVISAYKPNGGLEERFKLEAGTEEGVWDFVRTHLRQLPVFTAQNGQAQVIAERTNYLLYDRMVAFHVRRNVMVPLSAAEFYAGLAQRFPARDGMYFLPDQVVEYDRKRMTVQEVLQLQFFVTDEASAVQWLKAELAKKPQTFQEIHPRFMREISGWQKHEKPLELTELLEQNFLRYDGKGPIPAPIVAWLKCSEKYRPLIQELEERQENVTIRGLETTDPQLLNAAKDRWYIPDPNRAADLEKLRERALLKEFDDYRQSTQRRLKVFRLEAIRAGFKKAWQERDYRTIITVARKIPESVLQEDPKLLMWYDQAVTRTEEE
ncbi:DNA methyltransferase [Moorella sp. Hama-1]|uniref:DNA methyltransferase n=1 Tax=Moorella sp. Hama-1 TaxID=2138101 RepID=UPI000D641F5A|nr:DNA methyltransferase [Moorella sp. Hama-1]